MCAVNTCLCKVQSTVLKSKFVLDGMIFEAISGRPLKIKTRPGTRLPKPRVGGQGPYLRSLGHLGRSSEVREIKS